MPLSYPLLLGRAAQGSLLGTLPGRDMLLLFNEGSGVIAKNAWAAGASPVNQLHASAEALSQWWTNNTGATITDDYEPNPVTGETTATRIQLAGGGSSGCGPVTASGAGVTWTWSQYLKPATAASCNLRFFRGDTGGFTALPVLTQGAWQRVSLTFTTVNANFDNFQIFNDGANAADLSVYGAVLEAGPVMTAFQSPSLHMVFPLNTPMTWTSTGVTTASAGTYAAAIRQAPIAGFTQMTVHIAFKQSSVSPQNAAFLLQHLIWSDAKAQINAANYPNVQLRFSGDANGATQRLVNMADDSYHCLSGVVEASGVERLYFDGALCCVINQTITPFTHRGWNLLGQFNTNGMKGEVGCVAAYTQAHTNAQVIAGWKGIKSIMAAKGVTLP